MCVVAVNMYHFYSELLKPNPRPRLFKWKCVLSLMQVEWTT